MLPWQQIPIDTLTEVNKNLGIQIKRMPKEVVKGRFQHKKLQQKVKEMQTLLPLISNLLNPAMQARHWTKILRLAGKSIDVTSPSTTFKDIINLKLYNFENEVNEIVDIAQKEQKISK
jgi:dynein heavy chain